MSGGGRIRPEVLGGGTTPFATTAVGDTVPSLAIGAAAMTERSIRLRYLVLTPMQMTQMTQMTQMMKMMLRIKQASKQASSTSTKVRIG